MKKVIFIVLVLFVMLYGEKINAARSESFEKIISLINVPTKNIDGYEINEEIYNKYSLIVYGAPSDITSNQRWKNVDSGKWINEKTGQKGEYRVLGYSLAGTVVNNEHFPDDYSSGISPEDWNYIVIKDALSSWSNTEKYQTKEQYEYMLHQKLSRNGKTYNLTADSIGLSKARIEAYATWKTSGSIFTQKVDNQGFVWEATFTVPALAADAELNAKIDVINGIKYKFENDQETLEIPITFGAEVSNLGEYAKKDDIKNIYSELEVNNDLFDKVEDACVTSVGKNNKIVINKADYPNVNKVEIILRNTSVVETCFNSEAPLVSIKEVTLEIVFNHAEEQREEYIEVKDINKKKPNEIPKPVISNIRLYRKSITSKNNKSSLYVAKATNTQFICAGQILVVEATVLNSPSKVTFAVEGNSSIQTMDDLTKRFVYDEPKFRGESLMYYSVNELKSSYNLPRNMKHENGVYKLEYIIPYKTKQTLNSWITLRNATGNAMNIDKNKLFSRINLPYKIKIYAQNDGGSVTKQVNLDVFERWDTIYNRNMYEYVK